MKTYQQFAKRLFELIGDSQAVRITVPGFMPLTVEEIAPSPHGRRQISITHYGEQNGDPMRDPEMIFEIHDWAEDGFLAEPVYFRNDYAGVEQSVYTETGGPAVKMIRPDLKHELKIFARIWFRNLRIQGFFGRDASREVLS